MSKGIFTIDGFMYFYVTFLSLFIIMLPLGLNDYLAVNLDIERPTFQGLGDNTTLPLSEEPCFNPLTNTIYDPIDALISVTFTGSRIRCVIGSVPVVDALFNVVGVVVANLTFFFKLMTINPLIGVIGGIIFFPASVMFLIFIIRMIRGN